MKTNNLFKFTPFISTFILIFFLNISNQKTNTKLRILIWNTPSLSLGTYLSLSTGAGFLLSYIVTTNLASKFKSVNTIQYKSDKTKMKSKDNEKYDFNNFTNTNEKTLIERNMNDPLPTMKAQFRVIGKTEKYNKMYRENDNVENSKSYDYEESYMVQEDNNQSTNQVKQVSTDWNDDSFTRW